MVLTVAENIIHTKFKARGIIPRDLKMAERKSVYCYFQ